MRIRIKTEQELLNEFGGDWRRTIKPTWSSESRMEHLFGIDVTEKVFQKGCTPKQVYEGCIPAGDRLQMDGGWVVSFTNHLICEFEKGEIGFNYKVLQNGLFSI